MAKSVNIRHSQSGMVEKGCVGFSWTYLFFGIFVPLFRAELGVALLHVVFSILTFGLWNVIAAFIYNKQYMKRKLTNGWVLDSSDPNYLLAAMKLGVSINQSAVAA